jgi:hypothetical protein
LIRTLATWELNPPFSLEHLSWRASNNWFTSESGGPEWNRIAAKTGKWPTTPLLDKITTTGFIDYTDAIQGPVSASYRYSVGAVDVAGNEAKSGEITVRATR